jgi:hypothetical protein
VMGNVSNWKTGIHAGWCDSDYLRWNINAEEAKQEPFW